MTAHCNLTGVACNLESEYRRGGQETLVFKSRNFGRASTSLQALSLQTIANTERWN